MQRDAAQVLSLTSPTPGQKVKYCPFPPDCHRESLSHDLCRNVCASVGGWDVKYLTLLRRMTLKSWRALTTRASHPISFLAIVFTTFEARNYELLPPPFTEDDTESPAQR